MILAVNNINFWTIIYIIKNFHKIFKIIILSKKRKIDFVYDILLKILLKNIEYVNFELPKLNKKNEENLNTQALKFSSKHSFSQSYEILKNNTLLNSYNNYYGNNILLLNLAKSIHNDIYFWYLRLLVVKKVAPSNTKLLISRDIPFDPSILNNVNNKETMILFSPNPLYFLNIYFSIIKRELFYFFNFFSTKKTTSKLVNPNNNILLFAEDNIGISNIKRAQPHWYNSKLFDYDCNIHILKFRSSQNVHVDTYSLDNRIIIDDIRRNLFSKRKINSDVLKLSKNAFKSLIHSFKVKGYQNKNAFLVCRNLFNYAYALGDYCLNKNIRLVVFGDTYPVHVDAICLIAQKIPVKTIAFQYSNLSRLSVSMLSVPSKILIFSNIYKKCFTNKYIKPKTFISAGYIFNRNKLVLKQIAKKHRDNLKKIGVKFIIGYFDENVFPDDRWHLVGMEKHKLEILQLASFVLDNKHVAIIFKSQFHNWSPSKLLKDNEIFLKAVATGRFVDIFDADVKSKVFMRNSIFPSEVAMTCDLCIGNKIGSTAALESAICGIKTVLINPYNVKGFWDFLYKKSSIIFSNLEDVLNMIKFNKNTPKLPKNIGDWTELLDQFNTPNKRSSADILANEIKKEIDVFIKN